jgi:SAM-dependent methyltransferase
MGRLDLAAQIVGRPREGASVLDVGCREALLSDLLPPSVAYYGCDLVADRRGRVKYVGDFSSLEFDRTFDIVVALDVLEHLESPSKAFDSLVSLASQRVIVSLPNCYDLKSRRRFAFRGQLGGKYVFEANEPVDRHRWLMNRREIISFFESKAFEHGMQLQTADVTYGSSGTASIASRSGRTLSRVLPRSLVSETVVGSFEKRS